MAKYRNMYRCTKCQEEMKGFAADDGACVYCGGELKPVPCKHEHKSDFSYYESFGDAEKEPHFYCGDCKSHWWKGKEWSEEEWEKFVNEEV